MNEWDGEYDHLHCSPLSLPVNKLTNYFFLTDEQKKDAISQLDVYNQIYELNIYKEFIKSNFGLNLSTNLTGIRVA